MQRLSRIIILLSLFITSCGDGGSPTTEESNNLFLQQGNNIVEKNLSSSMMGLWVSEDYTIDDFTYTLRWEVTADKTTLAKRCTDDEGRSWLVQTSLSYDAALVAQTAELTPYAIPVETNKKVHNVELMTGNKPCRVAIDTAKIASDSLIASDTTEFKLTDDTFDNGVMTLSIGDGSTQVQLTKIQDR